MCFFLGDYLGVGLINLVEKLNYCAVVTINMSMSVDVIDVIPMMKIALEASIIAFGITSLSLKGRDSRFNFRINLFNKILNAYFRDCCSND